MRNKKYKVFYPSRSTPHYARIPALICTSGGTLLAFCELRANRSDWAEMSLGYKRSTDGGKSWSGLNIIMHNESGPVGNAVPIAARGNEVHFLFCKDYRKVYYCKSCDGGISFSQPRDITESFGGLKKSIDYKIIATGPGHGLHLENGRLLTPVWLSDGGDDGRKHEPNVAASIFSDDAGETWRCGQILPNTDNNDMTSYNETCAVPLENGKVRFYIRNNSPIQRKAYSESPTGAGEWSTAKFDANLVEPICMASALRAGDSILLAMPDPKEWDFRHGNNYGRRHNLTCYISRNDGETWGKAVIESGDAAYSDLAHDGKGNIYCLYENGTELLGGEEKGIICIKRFTLEEIKKKAGVK